MTEVEELANSRANCAFLIGRLTGGIMNLKTLCEQQQLSSLDIARSLGALLTDAMPLVEREFYGKIPKWPDAEPPDLLK